MWTSATAVPGSHGTTQHRSPPSWRSSEGRSVIAYGVCARSARSAVEEVRALGGKVSLLVLKTIYPMQRRIILEAAAGVSRVVVPEMNLGQYVWEIRAMLHDKEVISVSKMDTTLIAPDEIIAEGGLL